MLADGEYANLQFTTTNSPGSFMCTVLTLYTDIISAIPPCMCIIHVDLFHLYVSVYYRRQLLLFRFKDSSLSQKPRHIHEVLLTLTRSRDSTISLQTAPPGAPLLFFSYFHMALQSEYKPLGSNCEHANFLDCSV